MRRFLLTSDKTKISYLVYCNFCEKNRNRHIRSKTYNLDEISTLTLSLPTVLLSTVLRNFKFSCGREGVPRYLWATRLWGVSRIGNNNYCRTNAKVYEKNNYGSERVNMCYLVYVLECAYQNGIQIWPS